MRGQPLSVRFWDRVTKTDGCWLWTGQRNNKGYGMLWAGTAKRLAHRISFELAGGSIPHGSVVCHSCDNPQCVRPDHLRLGTQAENIREAFAKGRGRNALVDANRVKTHCVHGHEFTNENTRITPNGERACRECARLACRAQRAG